MQTIILLQLLVSSLTSLQTVYAETIPTSTPVIISQPQAPQPSIDDFMMKLKYCESDNRDITVLDTNNKYSYGWFQFQKSTFDYYGNLYNLPHDNIHSYDQQYAIAHQMIENGLWRNWKRCSLKIGVPSSSS